MKQLIVLVLFLVNSFFLFSQKNLNQKGYIIDLNGEKTEGIFDIQEWHTTPDFIVFNGKKKYPKDIKSFAVFIDDQITEEYSTKFVELETSPFLINNLNCENSFKLVQKNLFLKKLIGGSRPLYGYYKNDRAHFFVEKENKTTSLLYKRFHDCEKPGKYLITRYTFRNQLTSLLDDCKDIPKSKFKSITYSTKDLVKIIEKYYSCKGENTKKKDTNSLIDRRHKINASIGSGFTTASYTLDNYLGSIKYKASLTFSAKISYEFFVKRSNAGFSFSPYLTYRQSKIESKPREIFQSQIHELKLLGIGLQAKKYIKKAPAFAATIGLDYTKNLKKKSFYYADSAGLVTSSLYPDFMDNAFLTSNIGLTYHFNNFFVQGEYSFGMNILELPETLALVLHQFNIRVGYTILDTKKKK